jgi:hypothetical protein
VALRAAASRRRYRRAVNRAFARVMFYREQWAAAGHPLTEPEPTPIEALPQPPHSLCPYARSWLARNEPSLWTPTLPPLVRALRLAGCRERLPVLEVRQALLDYTRLPGRWPLGRRPAYRVLLSPTALVASPAHRAALNRRALAVAEAAGGGWVIGSPPELSAEPAAGGLLRPVPRLPVTACASATTGPALLYEPMLGYLGAFVAGCGRWHLDAARVHARVRGGALTLSLPRSRRPTLLEIVPAGAETVTVGTCERHGSPILAPAGQRR